MLFGFYRKWFFGVAISAEIFLPHAGTAFATPATGQVWQRSVDWVNQPGNSAGTTNGNPASDSLGNFVWQYESVPLGQKIGEPTSANQSPTPWCAGAPAKLTWDTSWYGGSGGWTGGDDVSPVIQQNTVIQSLNNTRVPLVRWLNPTVSNITVALSGTLSLSWSSTSLRQPIEFILMLQKADGSLTPLLLGDRKPANFTGGNVSEAPLIQVDFPALQIPAGGSIFYTLRYEDAASQSGWVTLDDSSLTITLKALAAVPLPANDIAVTDENELVNIEVLANDHWAPQALPRISIVAGPSHGTAMVRADQSIDYNPVTNFFGTDVFTYQIYDGASFNTATVTIMVNQPYYLYVSPSGNDSNGGTAWSNALATLEGARNQIRNLRVQNPSPVTNQAVEVLFDDGVYPISHTIILTADDAGTPEHSVTYRARHPLLASISGRKILNLNWQSYPAKPGAYMANLSATGLTQTQLDNFHTLIVNGVRAVRARLPDSGFYSIVSADPNTGDTYNKKNSFTFGTSNGVPNILPTWNNLTNVEIISYSTWTESRMTIASVDAANSQVHIQGSLPQDWADDYLADYGAFLEPNPPYNKTGATDGTIRYYVENVLEGLDTPGEWYVDPVMQQLYYFPRAGETITNSTFMVPVVNQLLQVTNASNLKFDSLTFCDADWTMPATGQPGLGQAFNMITQNALLISSATNVVFANGRVTRTGGGYGIQIQFGATGNTIINSEFVDNGGGGVMIGGTPGWLPDTTAENGYQSYAANERVALNNIHDNNAVWREAVGILALRNGGNRIAGNTISNTTYGGINVGWFDVNSLAAGHNQIAWNNISTFATLLYDDAGIYVVGSQPGTTIMGNTISEGLWTANHWHRAGVSPDGSLPWNNPAGPIAGIYTDDTSKGQLVDGNIVYDCNQGLFLHDLHDDLYLNNILADTQPQTWASIYVGNSDASSVDAGPNWIASSVIAWTKTNADSAILFDSYDPLPLLAMDRDIYAYGPVNLENPQSYGLPYLQSTGHDQLAVVTTNSLFVSPATHDYCIAVAAQPLVKSQGFTADWLFETPTSSLAISKVNFAIGHLILRGSNGPPGMPYRILISTNPAAPLANWSAVMTNTFSADGTFSCTNAISGSSAFFRLVSP